MNKLKLFVENFLVYGVGGVISKVIPLIMVPIVTRIMPDSSYYGISDLSNTVVQFGSAIAVMGMYDAMYRMFFEKEEEQYKRNVCSTSLAFTIVTSGIVFMLLILFRNQIAHYFFNNRGYAYIVYVSAMATLVGATNSIISAPTRMQNKRKVFLIINTISPLLSYSISIPLLLAGYYTIALPMAAVISGVVMEISFGVLNRSWFSIKCVEWKLLSPLLKIAIPLLPNFLIYWIFNSADKIMITNLVGIDAAGIYAVSSKLGQASQLIYTAFAGGWQFFALSTMKEENQVKTNSLVFEYLGVISYVATSFICAWSYLIFKVLFENSYIEGYIAAPYLFLAPLLLMLFQVAGSQFLVIKNTVPNMFILGMGAFLNILLNLKLIPLLGIEGAAIATLAGYIISVVICVAVLCKMNLMEISNRFIISSLVMVLFIFVWRRFFCDGYIVGTIGAFLVTMFWGMLYKNEVMQIASILKNVRKG